MPREPRYSLDNLTLEDLLILKQLVATGDTTAAGCVSKKLRQLITRAADAAFEVHWQAWITRPALRGRYPLDKPRRRSAQLTRSLDSRGSRRGSNDEIAS